MADAQVLPWPIIARRIPPAALAGAFDPDDGNVVELRRIRELRAFLARCREVLGGERDDGNGRR